MRSVATKTLAASIVCFAFTALSFSESKCECQKDPGPGGGVQCEEKQMATCDPRKGVCNCKCESIPPGKKKDEIIAMVWSRVEHRTIDPQSDDFKNLKASFHSTDKGGDFYLVTPSGIVSVGVPQAIRDELKMPDQPKPR